MCETVFITVWANQINWDQLCALIIISHFATNTLWRPTKKLQQMLKQWTNEQRKRGNAKKNDVDDNLSPASVFYSQFWENSNNCPNFGSYQQLYNYLSPLSVCCWCKKLEFLPNKNGGWKKRKKRVFNSPISRRNNNIKSDQRLGGSLNVNLSAKCSAGFFSKKIAWCLIIHMKSSVELMNE